MDQYKNTYFIGIGGIGMSALARYFHQVGKRVLGYDKTATALTKKLEEEGLDIHYDENVQEIETLDSSETLFIYTPAIPATHRELVYLQSKNIKIYKRSEVLGMISATGKCIAVAGTHGKTTTSSIIAHILQHSGYGCNAFIGGIMTNYNSNIIINPKSNTFVVEADEFDRSFLALSPDLSIITSMDADHLDIYGEAEELERSFELFAKKTKPSGQLIIKKELANKVTIEVTKSTYSLDETATFWGENIQIKDGKYHFDFTYNDIIIKDIKLGLPGRHNVENAVAAIAIAKLLSIDSQKIKNALADYQGVKRRFERIYSTDNVLFIDDYAHHPTELLACIKSVQEIYPNKKITGIFQPHLYTRTRDFADEFAQSLDLLDDIILLPIYPARERPLPGIDSQLILNKLKTRSKKLVEKSELLYELKSHNFDILLTLGAGDIDALVLPIKQILIS